jgi:hypothetical protein
MHDTSEQFSSLSLVGLDCLLLSACDCRSRAKPLQFIAGRSPVLRHHLPTDSHFASIKGHYFLSPLLLSPCTGPSGAIDGLDQGPR